MLQISDPFEVSFIRIFAILSVKLYFDALNIIPDSILRVFKYTLSSSKKVFQYIVE